MEDSKGPGAGVARLCIIGTALGYSLQGVVLKFIPCNPFVLNGMEKTVCFFILGLSRKSFRIHFNHRTIPGAVFMYLTSVLFVIANKMTTAANAVVLQYTNPIFVLLISCLLLHKKVNRRDILFASVMMCGMILFFIDDINPGNMAGNMIAVMSGVSMAAANMYAYYSHTDIGEYGMINCLIAITVGALVTPFRMPQFTWQTGMAVVIYGIFCSGLPVVLFAKGAPKIEPLGISILLMLEPICGPIWVALVIKEFPGRMALVGSIIVLSALVINSISGSITDVE